ncbi:TPA: hypothetical protein N2E96_002136 [Salmonella enterica]|nr:hypothetical protein [Salmonella enterica]
MNKRNARQRLKTVLLTGGILLAFMVVALFIADVAIRHPEGTAAFSMWMQAHRSGWLIWRLFIYILLGWGIWRIVHAPGFRAEYRQPLIRICGASVAFILVCEYALLKAQGG